MAKFTIALNTTSVYCIEGAQALRHKLGRGRRESGQLDRPAAIHVCRYITEEGRNRMWTADRNICFTQYKINKHQSPLVSNWPQLICPYIYPVTNTITAIKHCVFPDYIPIWNLQQWSDTISVCAYGDRQMSASHRPYEHTEMVSDHCCRFWHRNVI